LGCAKTAEVIDFLFWVDTFWGLKKHSVASSFTKTEALNFLNYIFKKNLGLKPN